MEFRLRRYEEKYVIQNILKDDSTAFRTWNIFQTLWLEVPIRKTWHFYNVRDEKGQRAKQPVQHVQRGKKMFYLMPLHTIGTALHSGGFLGHKFDFLCFVDPNVLILLFIFFTVTKAHPVCHLQRLAIYSPVTQLHWNSELLRPWHGLSGWLKITANPTRVTQQNMSPGIH